MNTRSQPTHDGNLETVETIELLAFRVGAQEYCVDIMAVREIRGWTKATPLPHAPDFIRGVVNLRGAVLPIIDLSVRFNLPRIEDNARNVIIVVQSDSTTIGLLVTAVSDIVTIEKHLQHSSPDLAINEDLPDFIKNIAVLNDNIIRIIDLASVFPKQQEVAA